MQKKIASEMLDALRQEVTTLENKNTHEIQFFEKSLQELQGLISLEELDWSPSLDCIEVITMEKIPSLSSSIRKITA